MSFDRQHSFVIFSKFLKIVLFVQGYCFRCLYHILSYWQVPFRLTREIVDGMGVTGVEGVFRRCCEETLSVMRTNKEALLTIIEVLQPSLSWNN